MKKIYSSIFLLCLVVGLTASAQDKTTKPSDKKVSEYDEIVIKQKNPGKNAKVIVEVRDGDVIVNGKPNCWNRWARFVRKSRKKNKRTPSRPANCFYRC